MTLKASDFLFCLSEDPEEGVFILIDTVGSVQGSGHLDELIKPFWPAGIVMDEVTESTFLVSEDLTIQEVKDELINAGFTFSQKWQDEVEAE